MMADGYQQPASISARIASLKLNEVARVPGLQQRSSLCPPPPLTKKPSLDLRSNTTNKPPPQPNGSGNATNRGNQLNGVGPPPPYSQTVPSSSAGTRPSLPPRPPPRSDSSQPKPVLPPRRPSERGPEGRSSIDSQSSGVSITSSLSANTAATTVRTPASRTPSINGDTRALAPAYDPSTLPVQFPTKPKNDEKEQGKAPRKSISPAIHPPKLAQPLARPRPPPLLPHRPKSSAEIREAQQPELQTTLQESWGEAPPVSAPAVAKGSYLSPTLQDNGRKLPPPMPRRPEPPPVPQDDRRKLPPPIGEPIPGRSALSFGMNKHTEEPPSIPANRPPPIPLASRPNLTQIQATLRPPPATRGLCLKCRDFSGPDLHAARFPRQSIPSASTHWIATQVTRPFPSATDKARALFTWLHHNIEYDCDAFFNNNVKQATPESTIERGLAVCEGYAGLFTSLATVAGLESIVISGHGKGFGHTPITPGAPIAPFSSNHAWNAVKIDNGEWQLIDACWGAGSVNGRNMPYQKHFTPMWFTMDSVEFGLKHFPTNKSHFLRPDGYTPSWEEYFVGDPGGEGPQIYATAEDNCGLLGSSFLPRHKKIPLIPTSSRTVRFQFTKICDHWDSERMGKGKQPLFVLHTEGRGGNNKDTIPFETDGRCWWIDIEREELGVPGQQVFCYRVDTLGGKDAGGVSAREYREAKGRKAMSWSGLAMWELV